MTDSATPVVFIHGLWLHSAAWDPWVQLFADSGYRPSAPGWPGDQVTVAETRATPDSVANFGIEDVTAHYRAFIDQLEEKPILIGHSFGGMIAEKLLGEDYAAAAIAIDAAQIKGVLPLPLSALRSTLPVFKNPANKHKAVTLSAEQFRYSFGNALTEEESDALYEKWVIAAPGRPLFEAAAANFSLHSPAKVETGNEKRGPLLLIMGGQDHTVPEAITKSTLKQYRHSAAVTELVEFEGRGHSLTIDGGWREVATACLTWLGEQRL
ncbi:pimeloyl-ACP methyl ester carboxylesterase [Jatrophihabitans sp. GAS493]|uniref:alpha/beta hydrolase n=1 Tax=Jatrophihabitans sp. GAS493 TaxID=1907575 RepID=UPI000BB9AF51|nr:alpha/beta hydrolase [Jatrophihabitans sp. GAS493]SOD74950.1 pimeloyl-ACP methyl ester carboxylesterase [Jatrophihabitans sp. GAS493]